MQMYGFSITIIIMVYIKADLLLTQLVQRGIQLLLLLLLPSSLFICSNCISF